MSWVRLHQSYEKCYTLLLRLFRLGRRRRVCLQKLLTQQKTVNMPFTRCIGMNRLFTTFYIFPNFSCTFRVWISLSFKSEWPIWVNERKLSVVRWAMLKHPVHSLGSLFLFEHASHKFMGLCINPINWWEIMRCMPCKVRGLMSTGVFENVTPDQI